MYSVFMSNTDFIFNEISPLCQNIIDNFDVLLQDIQKLNTRQLHALPLDIKNLSHQLTDERSSRHLSYMNEKRFLSAYTRYFMWWNLVRLTKVFSGFKDNAFDILQDGSYCLDIGSGPLTVITALWLSRPELWTKKITWYVMDLSSSIMSLGEEIYLSVVSKTIAKTQNQNIEPWKIIRIKGSLGTFIKNKVSFVSCANVFNEIFEDSNKPLEQLCKNYTENIFKYLEDKVESLIFIAEPGIPRSARFISLTREALLRKKYNVLSPCAHLSTCPMEGKRGQKWCHFVLDATLAPKNLQKLSEESYLTKDRASISFIFAKKNNTKLSLQESSKAKNAKIPLRVNSEIIKLPNNKIARYCCSSFGLILFIEKTSSSKLTFGQLIYVDNIFSNKSKLLKDKKSNAIIIYEK